MAPLVDPDDLLTDDEKEALDLTGKLANKLGVIIRKGGSEVVAEQDWAEAAVFIHQIQHMIMAQACARAFPGEYRLLGRTIR